MKFEDKILHIIKLFNNYFKKRKLKRKMPFFVKYLNDLNDLFKCTEQISHPSDSETNYYQAICDMPKYSDIVKRYRNSITRIDSHNQIINEINHEINNFDFKAIIADPTGFDKAHFEGYYKTINLIESFQNKNENTIAFISLIRELEDNFDNITEQYQLIKLACQEFDDFFDVDKYLDGRNKEHLKSILNDYNIKLNQYPKRYYEITQLDKINNKITTHNDSYIERHLRDDIFNDINGRKLDDSQKKAILCDSVSNLVIAGAGSGKTLTICGKAKFLIEIMGIPKEDILFLSYSSLATEDLREKLEGITFDLNVSTFHSLGLRIIEMANGVRQNIDTSYDAIIESYFSEELFSPQNEEILRKVFEFYARFSSVAEKKVFASKGELFKNLKRQDLSTLKNTLIDLSCDKDKKETIKKERVKSYEEMAIANFYYINGIEYQYEKPYKIDTSTPDYRQYNPDFTLIENEIYHEHYGIDKEGRCTQFSKKEESKYLKGMKWKNNLHTLHENKYIKTYSHEFQDGTLFESLERQLKEHGVEFKPLTAKQIRDSLNSIYKNKNFESFIRLVKSFINLYKTRYTNRHHFEKMKNETFANVYEKQRASMFLDICENIYVYYRKKLNGKIDFDDMILEAMDKVLSLDCFKYKYIIVDEFQDISYSRMQLLRSLIKHGNSKLFAVGDDWQSIYRFSGCDLGIFLDFNDYFEMATLNKLSTNFRNSKELYDIVEPFITANPKQIKKEIICKSSKTNPLRVVYSDDKFSAFNIALQDISQENPMANILLLGRNNFDLKDLQGNSAIIVNKDKSIYYRRFPNLKMTFKTVHGSKGLEEDYVIVLNNDDSRTGFPNKIEDDPILSLILSYKDSFIYAEERRLFYVALTRTRNYCYLLVNINSVSDFVDELIKECYIVNPEVIDEDKSYKKCPKCETGNLILRRGGVDNGWFYGCSNFPYCDYSYSDTKVIETSKRCPCCGHFILWRKTSGRNFLACSNFPRCKFTPSKYEYEFYKPRY